jgi:bifunctional ADP-heptose synthase (sugar kinase/adenylyltransferase)
MLTASRLAEISRAYARLRVVMVGDVFLDRYLHIDPARRETSIETGLPVHNVVAVRSQPGGGGNVLANLAALRPATLTTVSYCGDDGLGFDLRRAMEAVGLDASGLIVSPERLTPTYVKPLLIRPGQVPEELSRLDIRSRTPTPPDLEEQIVLQLRRTVADADVVVAMDQIPEPGCGVLTARVKAELATLAEQYGLKVFIADSRTSIGEFQNVRIKVNRAELLARFSSEGFGLAPRSPTPETVGDLAVRWSDQIGRDVFVTLGEGGILAASGAGGTAPARDGLRHFPGCACTGSKAQRVYDCATSSAGKTVHAPGVKVSGPTDPVGCGDTVLAHLAMALAAGASNLEACQIANLAAAVVLRKIGTTGSATITEVAAAMTEQGATPNKR